MLTLERFALRTACNADGIRSSGREANKKSIPNKTKTRDFPLSRRDSSQFQASNACGVTVFQVPANKCAQFWNFFDRPPVWTLVRVEAKQSAIVPKRRAGPEKVSTKLTFIFWV
jgi:hypothetical protein